ncbi:hypothetical protein BDV12DRAFT_209280 [Aspergillus spectabilis]
MAFGTIYSYSANPRVCKIQAIAYLNGLNIDEAADFVMGETNKTSAFLAKFPHGKVPAFEGEDGTTIFDSDAIARYVAESGPLAAQLVGRTPQERAVIQQWVNFAASDIITHVTPLALWRFGVAEYDVKVEDTAFERLQRSLSTLERHLRGRKWIATEDRLSLADVTVASYLIWGFAVVIDSDLRARYPSVVAWYERVNTVEAVRLAFGDLKFVQKRKEPAV